MPSPRRTLYLHPRAQFEALPAARWCGMAADVGASYATRAGIEGTLASDVRRWRLRYRLRRFPFARPLAELTVD